MPGHHRDAILLEMADALERRSDEILRENRLDVDAAKRGRSAPALIDRLLLDEDRVADMARAVRTVAALPDPIGTVDMGRTLPNGLDLVRRRVPLGVVAVVYEGRPNVTVDAVSLCIKSGNAAILRGSRLASRSNLILAEVLTGALIEAEAPRWAVALLGSDREELRRLVQMTGAVDLVIPRGGEDLKALPDGALQGARHLRRVGQQPRVRARRRRPRHGAEDRRQRQGAAPRRVQRGGDPARAPRRRRRRSCRRRRAPAVRGRRAPRGPRRPRRPAATPPRASPRPPRTTTAPSSSA